MTANTVYKAVRGRRRASEEKGSDDAPVARHQCIRLGFTVEGHKDRLVCVREDLDTPLGMGHLAADGGSGDVLLVVSDRVAVADSDRREVGLKIFPVHPHAVHQRQARRLPRPPRLPRRGWLAAGLAAGQLGKELPEGGGPGYAQRSGEPEAAKQRG